MNTFFKSTVYAAFVGLTIFSSCSDEIKDFTVKPDGTEQGDGSATTAETKNLIINATATGKKWVVEDVIYVGSPSAAENEVTIDNQSSGFTKFTVSKIGEGATSASFEGEIPANLSGKKLLVFYGNAADMKVAASKVTLDLASQNGTLMSATADYTGEESINATFSVENASVELKIQTTDVSGLTEATLSFDESSTMGFTSSKEFTADGVGTYTMQKSMTAALTAGENNEYTISFIPTVSETPATMNISLKATKESGDYTYSTTQDVSSSNNSYITEISTSDYINTLSGEGTEASPYIIDNVDKFMGIAETTDKFYQLSRDLDFTDIEFTPIATFDGTFDGNGMTISNLTFSTTNDNGGIFAENTGTIKNLTASKVIITQEGSIAADKGVGILVGTNAKTISNSSVINSSSIKATITTGSAQGNLGLLAGFNKGTGSIKECKVSDSSITISEETASKTNLGGFAGKSLGSVTFSSANNVTVSHECDLTGGGSNIGGFLGYGNGTIEGCSSNAQISDAQTAGDKKAITIAGFVGTTWLNPGTVTIKGCYAAGIVTSKLEQSTNGGFIGNCTTKANDGTGQQIISNCYTSVILTDASTKFNGSAFIKNINNVTATECYYVNGTQTIPSGKEENLSIVQKSAADLKDMASSFNSTLNWTDYQFVAGTDAEPLIITRK